MANTSMHFFLHFFVNFSHLLMPAGAGGGRFLGIAGGEKLGGGNGGGGTWDGLVGWKSAECKGC